MTQINASNLKRITIVNISWTGDKYATVIGEGKYGLTNAEADALTEQLLALVEKYNNILEDAYSNL